MRPHFFGGPKKTGRRTPYHVEFDSKYDIFKLGAGVSEGIGVGITLRLIVTPVAYSNSSGGGERRR